MKDIHTDEKFVYVQRSLGDRIFNRKITTDTLAGADVTTTPGYPWTYAEENKRPIGSMFAAEILPSTLKDMYARYQLAPRIVNMPVEDALSHGFELVDAGGELITGDVKKKAMKQYNKYKHRWDRFFKLARLYGRCEMIYGYNDDISLWASTRPAAGTVYTYLQPVPEENETELKETDGIPRKIVYLTVNFGSTNLTLDPSRFTHVMNPKITEETKKGESCLMPIVNLLEIQIHMDWSVGQSFFRRAGGLLGLFAPKKTQTAQDKQDAISSLSNHNSKTVVYVPFGWTVKDLLKAGGNLAIARTYRVILEQIAAGSGIPVSMLIGSQRGALAPPEEDIKTYMRTVKKVQEIMMTPALEEFFKRGQAAKLIPGGVDINIKWNKLETKSPLERERELTELGAMRLLQARMEQTADKEGNITNPNVEGAPSSKELIKLIMKK